MRQEIIEYLLPLNDEETEALGNALKVDRNLYMEGGRDVVRAEKLLKMAGP